MLTRHKKLDNQNVQDLLSLTPLQEGMLFHYLKHPENNPYFEQLSLQLKGQIQIELVKQAWQYVINTNEMLRTVYRWEKLQRPIQIVLKELKVPIRIHDLTHLSSSEQCCQIAVIKEEDLKEGIDLSYEPFRLTLLLLSAEEALLMISNHHIIYDGWSTGIILKEFLQAYISLLNGTEPERVMKTSFKEFIGWLQRQELEKQKDYWRDYLADFDSQIKIPGRRDNSDPTSKEQTNLQRYSFCLDDNLAQSLTQFVREKKMTLATVFYSTWGILLQRYNNLDDVVFGTPVSGRHAKITDLDQLVGLFINTIPLRVQSSGQEKVLELLQKIDSVLKERVEYESVPLVEIKSCSALTGEEALFDSIVVIENYPLDQRFNELNQALQITDYEMLESTTFDLTVTVELNPQIKVQFNSWLGNDRLIKQMAGHFQNILSSILTEPEQILARIDLLSSEERREILEHFNQTQVDFPENSTISGLLEAQVERTPNLIAAISGDESLTYAELNSKANKLARTLRAKGIQPDQRVGIMVDRSLEMMVGIYGILKAGGAYLPIDPGYPTERIQFMLDDSETRVLLTQGKYVDLVEFAGEMINLDDSQVYEQAGGNLSVVNNSHHLAYIIYTSGSTGKPKGVMVEHYSVMNRLHWGQRQYPLTQVDTILQKTPFTFDVSVWELFWWSLPGAKVCFLSPGGEKEPKTIVETIEKYQVTITHFVPSMLQLFLSYMEMNPEVVEKLWSLRQVFASGEALNRQQVERFQHSLYTANGTTLHNLYGPTEATVEVTYFDCVPGQDLKTVPIGKPIDNTRMYILSQDGQLQPVGIPGELCIAGVNLARGYLNRPELTAEKFVEIEIPSYGRERIYRTGDLACWLPDGNIEYLGRIDHQVKIRGFRIELGEIENQLLDHPAVREVVVIDRTDDQGGKYLCAYLVSDQEITVGQLREFLGENLPAYMIPSYFVYLDQMPLTLNGKVNRKALPEPTGKLIVGREYTPPRNTTEETLVTIFQEVLQLNRVGIYDNFFELGGHSLKATYLLGKIHRLFDVEVPIRQFFQTPTIYGISQYIQDVETKAYQLIPRVEEKEYYRTSSAQKRMYLLQQLNLDQTAYNMSGLLTVGGTLDLKQVDQVFQSLIQRHETLRTSFEQLDGKIVQRIHERVDFAVIYEDRWAGSDLSVDVDGEQKVDNWYDVIQPFDLAYPPLFRVKVVRIAVDEYIFIFDMHHIISDGISLEILIQEFAQLYQGEELEEMAIQYRDYAEWQDNRLDTDAFQRQKEYWLEQFQDEIPTLSLPTDFSRPLVQNFAGDLVRYRVDQELIQQLMSISRETGTTMFMILLSALNILLAKYSGQEDIVIGTPMAGRGHLNVQKIIGVFINTLALRNAPKGDKRYREFLEEVKAHTVEGYENQEYPFEELVEALHLERDLSRNPLFNVLLNLQEAGFREFTVGQMRFKQRSNQLTKAKFDLTVAVIQDEAFLEMEFVYSTQLFRRQTIERMVAHYQKILETIAADLEIQLAEIDLLTAEEREVLLYKWNQTQVDFPKEQTLSQIFTEQAAQSPDQIALIYQENRLTYRELNEKANQVARVLRAKGVGANDIVGICIERSLEMMIGILGILKAGGAYLPIMPTDPVQRIQGILEDSQAKVLLTHLDVHPAGNLALTRVDLGDPEIGGEKRSNLQSVNQSTDLAYVLYTSGSTGKPKGVLVEHRSVINTITHLQSHYPLEATDLILQSTVYTFDASVRELLWWFFGGGTCCLLRQDEEKDPCKIVQTIAQYQITHVKFVPLLLNEVLSGIEKLGTDQVRSLKYVLVGGEALPGEVVKKYFRILPAEIVLCNLYGPTETTVHCTEHVLQTPISDAYAAIGRPIANNQVYILDTALNPVPVGVAGEIYIGGVGVARGYLNNPELTEERFISNPFRPGERMYKTGDLGRWLTDGQIDFLGRTDHQVKIRGYRIETGEIENLILKYDGVQEVAVTSWQDQQGVSGLCAYIVSALESNLRLQPAELRKFLAERLPEYMIPAHYTLLSEMPLTASGKVDRKKLPEPQEKISQQAMYQPPTDEIEVSLVAIWQELLGVERIGIHDNFFALGGHSLKITTLIANIYKDFQVEVPFRQIFQMPTIAELAAYIRQATKQRYSLITPVGEKEYYETSPAQKRMYMLQQMNLQSTVYNMPGILEVTGELSRERLEDAFRQLITRHESLRTSFLIQADQIVQKVHPQVEFRVEEIALSAEVRGAEGMREEMRKFVRPFDLKNAPLLRVAVAKLDQGDEFLIFDLHHIISDGISMDILTREFADLYAGKSLSEFSLHYKDYAEWQNGWLKSEQMNSQEEYWLQRFGTQIPVLQLPTDHPRPLVQSFAGGSVSFTLDAKRTARLRWMANEYQSTMYMVLLAGVNILLAKYSGQDDILVGSPIAGRSHPDLEQIMGMFVNTLVLRNQPAGEQTFGEFLEAVKETTVAAHENQDFQFEELVDRLQLQRDPQRNPLFDVMFAMQNPGVEEIQVADLTLRPYPLEDRIAKFDLTINAREVGGEIRFHWNYCTSLFTRETIQRMGGHLLNIFSAIVDDPLTYIRDIQLLTDGERKRIMDDFNHQSDKSGYSELFQEETIQEVFERWVEQIPERIAVGTGADQLTYRELNAKTNRLARKLRRLGVQADEIVGIMVGRSLEMVIGILAILKTGGAYLPISPEFPDERVLYLLADSQTRILLTDDPCTDRIATGETVVINIQDELIADSQIDSNSSTDNIENLQKINYSHHLAYVIYTSGSTGHPKGVMIEHKSVLSLVAGLAERIYARYAPHLQVALVAPYYFDASVQQIFGALLQGHTLWIVPEKARLEGRSLLAFYNRHGIDLSDGTPTHLSLLTNGVTEDTKIGVKHFIIGGDVLSGKVVQEFLARCSEKPFITNIYGPTECCVDTTSYHIAPDQPLAMQGIPIGKPMLHETVYILGKDLEVLPIGVPGEVYIAGAGVGRGYLNNAELTKQRFIDHPFKSGRRMYRTGDRARWLADGNIEFLGRIDHQVKIRGYRIELGEIESQLLTHEMISAVVVSAREDHDGSKYLVAYFVSDQQISANLLREYLGQKLPAYMIPTYLIQLEQLPLTNNGKIDRKSLPEPAEQWIRANPYTPPENETEEKMVAIWQEVLGYEEISTRDNFFELGGHSLKATYLVGKIHKEFDVELPLSEVFKRPTIVGLSQYLEQARKNKYQMIEKVPEKGYYETSSAQKRMYMLQQMNLESTGYNMPGIFWVEGDLELARLESAFCELIRRHETLRTSFTICEGQIVQMIHHQVEFAIQRIPGQLSSPVQREITELLTDVIRPFDLNQAPLLRVAVVEAEQGQHLLICDLHHIIADGISMEILMGELTDLFAGEQLSELSIQYKDYAAWQNRLLNSDQMQTQEEYWLQRFSDEIPVLQLPTDLPRPSVQSFDGASLSFTIEAKLTEGLRQLAKQVQGTLYMVLLAGIQILLAKYSGQEDIIIGSPIAGRSHPNLEKIIGMFVNTLALRNQPTGKKRVIEFVGEVKASTLGAYENQDFPFEELVNRLSLHRAADRNPLFDVMFAMQNMATGEIAVGDVKLHPYQRKQRIVKFDLTINAREVGEEIILEWDYCTNLFHRETIERMNGHLKNILSLMIEDPTIGIREIQMLTTREKEHILRHFNQQQDFQHPHLKLDLTIQEVYERLVEQIPDQVAVIADGQQLTYAELNARANHLAQRLRAQKVKRNQIIGLLVGRSVEMIIGILAILKSGGAYLPISPDYPDERIQYLLKDSQTSILLTEDSFADQGWDQDLVVINIKGDDQFGKECGQTQANLERVNQPDDLAYVIYTSGSTGNPKGVMIEHKSVLGLVAGLAQRVYARYEPHLQVALVAPYYFDASVQQIFGVLLLGHTLCIVPEEARLAGKRLIDFYNQYQIDLSDGTPTHLSILTTGLTEERQLGVKHLIIGGDVLSSKVVEEFWARSGQQVPEITNIYGPTECCVDTTSYLIEPMQPLPGVKIPIGKPMLNESVYILGKDLEVLPIGVSGELYIAGTGVGRGYLNNAELTAERFIDHPFEPGQKLYRTGDLARWLPDGNIEFLGRMDHQVKVRGYRIELGEIESQLRTHKMISDAVVVAKEDHYGSKYLCGYYVSSDLVQASELRESLGQKLPEYMIPSYLIRLEELPVTSNGKIDRKALPEPTELLNLDQDYTPPANETEAKLVAIWQEVLGFTQIGTNDNFFVLGGHSFKVIMMSGMVQQEWNLELPLRVVFEKPTIKELAVYIQNAVKTTYPPIEPLEKRAYYPVSPAQKRFYVLHQLEDLQTVYNMPHVLLVEGELDVNRLEEAYQSLIMRHETLRTSFEMCQGEPVQIICDQVEATIETLQVQDTEVEDLIHSLIQPFDLAKAPLVRVVVIETLTRQLLFFDSNHILLDGVSIEVLIKEWMRLYMGDPLTENKIQYKDFVVWQEELFATGQMKEKEEYWLDTLQAPLPDLKLPIDFPRPMQETFAGDQVPVRFDKETSARIQRFSIEHGVTLYVFLLTVYNILLAYYTQQEDLIVGTVTGGRVHPDIDQTVGMFINTLPMRNRPKGEKGFETFLQEVKESTFLVYENQEYPFELMVKNLGLHWAPGKNPLLKTLFFAPTFADFETVFDQLRLTPLELHKSTARFDFLACILPDQDEIQLLFEYKTALFKRTTIEKMRDHYIEIVEQVVENPSLQIQEIELSNQIQVAQEMVLDDGDFGF